MLDVYDTLLDMTLVERKVNELMDNKRGYRIWFEIFMQYSFVDNCMVQFNPFVDIASATLQMAAKLFNRSVSAYETLHTISLLSHLPLREGISQGLSMLYDQQYKLAAVTNAPYNLVIDRMERTGLISYFEEVLSAEAVEKYKPCKEVYEWAAGKLGVACSEVLFVSAHGWDIAGAANAGMSTAYLRSSVEMLYPLAPAPFIVKDNLEELALAMTERFQN